MPGNRLTRTLSKLRSPRKKPAEPAQESRQPAPSPLARSTLATVPESRDAIEVTVQMPPNDVEPGVPAATAAEVDEEPRDQPDSSHLEHSDAAPAVDMANAAMPTEDPSTEPNEAEDEGLPGAASQEDGSDLDQDSEPGGPPIPRVKVRDAASWIGTAADGSDLPDDGAEAGAEPTLSEEALALHALRTALEEENLRAKEEAEREMREEAEAMEAAERVRAAKEAEEAAAAARAREEEAAAAARKREEEAAAAARAAAIALREKAAAEARAMAQERISKAREQERARQDAYDAQESVLLEEHLEVRPPLSLPPPPPPEPSPRPSITDVHWPRPASLSPVSPLISPRVPPSQHRLACPSLPSMHLPLISLSLSSRTIRLRRR